MIKLNETTSSMLWDNAKRQIRESINRLNAFSFNHNANALEERIAYIEKEFEIISNLKNMLIRNGLDIDNTFDTNAFDQQINVFKEYFAFLAKEKRVIEYVLQENLGNVA